MPEVILPCPACGSHSTGVTNAGTSFWVYCHVCVTSGPIADSEYAAIEAWENLPRMSAMIAWQFQAAGAALALQRIMDAAQAMREAQQAYEQYGSNEDSVTEAEAVFDGLIADVRNTLNFVK